jgi:mRNA-degrading endonuclease RelE of RelBE toxin-antitoxin system
MPYRFRFSRHFDQQIKRLAKRNPHLRSDLETFLNGFDPARHPVIPGASGARKARMKVSGRGKSGGYRVIYFVHVADQIWLLTVYDKVRTENLSLAEIDQIAALIRSIKAEDNGPSE